MERWVIVKHAGDLWYHFDENPGIEESPAGAPLRILRARETSGHK